MKKTLLMTSVALAIGFGAPAAMASDGTVTITGKIVASACTVDPNSKAITVVLPTATPNSFLSGGNPAAGQVAGRTRFTIELKDCDPAPESYTNVTTGFSGAFDSAYPGVLKNNAASPAGNVGVRLLDNNNNPIDINDTGDVVTTPLATGDMSLDFLAAYESTSATAVTTGDVESIATFTIGYN